MLTLGKKIIVAIDGSPQSDKAAEEAVRLASGSGSRFKSHIFALTVLPKAELPEDKSVYTGSGCVPFSFLNEVQKQMFYVVEKAAHEAKVELESLAAFGDPATEIMKLAEEKACDVVVIGSSGKGRVKRALLGSVSTAVALQAHISVYIVR